MSTPTAYANAELVSTANRLGLAYQLSQISAAGGAYYNTIDATSIFKRIPSRRDVGTTGKPPWPIAVILPAKTDTPDGATQTTEKIRDFAVLILTQSTPGGDDDLWAERMIADVESRIGNFYTLPRGDGVPTCFRAEVVAHEPITKLLDESYAVGSYIGIAIRVRTTLYQEITDPSQAAM